jgi:hypothetical protein
MVALTKLEKVKRRHICIYGPPKAGKTKLLGTLAEAGYFIDLVDCESGVGVLEQLSTEAQERINVIPLMDTREYPIAIETCLKISTFPKTKPLRICLPHGKVECMFCTKTPDAVWSTIDFSKYTDKHVLAFDSLTQISNSSMAQLCKGKDLDYRPGWDEYNPQGNHLNFFLGNIQNCPYNVVVITHETATETTELSGEKQEKLFPVGGTRNFSRTLAKFFDDVVHMEIFNRRHRGVSSTLGVPNVLAGTRSDLKLENMAEPSLVPFFTGEIPPANDAQAKAVSLLKGVGGK